jgi:hypothetical protein
MFYPTPLIDVRYPQPMPNEIIFLKETPQNLEIVSIQSF